MNVEAVENHSKYLGLSTFVGILKKQVFYFIEEVSCGKEARIAEGLGLRFALSMAVDLCFTKLIMESDRLELITVVNGPQNHASYFHFLAQDCQQLSLSFQSCNFQHLRRTGNKATHNPAKLACTVGDSVWIEKYPLAIANAIISDCTNLPLVE